MKNIVFQKFRFFVTENRTLFNERQSKEEFLSQIFKGEYVFKYYGNDYKYKCRLNDGEIILGTIGRHYDRDFFDDDLNMKTNTEYEFAFIVININTNQANNFAQTVYSQLNKKLSVNMYSLLKALYTKINDCEDHKIEINPENMAKDHFWDAIGSNVITKLVISYAPRNLFCHKALTDLSKDMSEKMNAKETKLIVENSSPNSTGLNLEGESREFMNEILEDTSKGAAKLKAYAKTITCYDSESKEEIIEKEISIDSDNMKSLEKFFSHVKDLFND